MKNLLLALILGFVHEPLFAAPATYREFRQEQARLIDAVRRDIRQNLLHIKDATNAMGSTLTATGAITGIGLAKDPKDLRKKLAALPPHDRREAMLFYAKLASFQKHAAANFGQAEGRRNELKALSAELQKHADRVFETERHGRRAKPTPVPGEEKPRPAPKAEKTPKVTKGK